MLVSEVKEKMTSEEYVGWNLYYTELNERSNKSDKDDNLLGGSVGSLIGALT